MEYNTKQRPALVRTAGGLNWLTQDTLKGMARRKALLGYVFLLPTMLGLFIFTIGPIIFSMGLSMFSWNIIEEPQFVGAGNYSRLAEDATALTSFRNTLVFVGLAVSVQLTLSLLLSLAVSNKKMSKWMRYIFRSVFFLPLLTSAATVSIVLAYLFQKDFGPINYYLSLLGLPRVPWLVSSQWSLVAAVITYVWHQLGFTFLIFIGGLAGIPVEIQDAADVDGAKGLARLWAITIPLLSPTILFATVTGVIGALQVFVEPYVLTKGGPGDSSRTVVMVIQHTAFQNLEFGYASAIAMILFLLIMVVTGIQFWLSKRWVHYQ